MRKNNRYRYKSGMSDSSMSADELVSYVCSKSIDIQDLIENHDPKALEEFNDFYEKAIQALDMQIEKVSSLDMEVSNYFDTFNEAVKELKILREKVFNLAKEKKQVKDAVDILTNENALLEKDYQALFEKDDPTDYQSQIEAAQKEIDELEQKQKELDSQLEQNKNSTTVNYTEEIESIKKQIVDVDDGLAVKIKKNQRRAKELEVRIKKLSESMKANSATIKEQAEAAENEELEGPSTIIHRTTGSVQDQIRELKTSLEEALKQNGSLKTNLKGLNQDLDAMREENFQLKELVRSVQKSSKK